MRIKEFSVISQLRVFKRLFVGKDNFLHFYSIGREKCWISNLNSKFAPSCLMHVQLFPNHDSKNTQWKLMAKLGALNIVNGEKFLTSLPNVCPRYLYLENDTDKKNLKIKSQAFWTQKTKVISSSLFTPWEIIDFFHNLKLLCQQRFTFWGKTHRMCHTVTNSGYLETRAGVGSVALQMLQHGRWSLSRGPPPCGTSACGLFFSSKSKEILGSISSSSLWALPLCSHSHIHILTAAETEPQDNHISEPCLVWYLFNIRGVCPTVHKLRTLCESL